MKNRLLKTVPFIFLLCISVVYAMKRTSPSIGNEVLAQPAGGGAAGAAHTDQLSIADYIAQHGQPTIIQDTLMLENKGITSLEGLEQIHGIENVRYLFLGRNKISIIPPNIFINLGQLEQLDLSNNRIMHIMPGAFNGLQSLLGIDLGHNQLISIHSGTFQGIERTLNVLDLNHNHIVNIAQDAFQRFQQLHWIVLNGNPISANFPESKQQFRNKYNIPYTILLG